MTNVCKTCGGKFSNPEYLQEHWDKNHKDRGCLRCDLPKARPSKEKPFCETCERDLSRPHQFLTRQEKLEKQIFRTALRAQKWNARLSNLMLLRETMLKTKAYNGSTVSEFCGHGEKKGRCIPCNPIFANITEKTMAEAQKAMSERTKAELQNHHAKLQAQKKRQEIIEVELD